MNSLTSIVNKHHVYSGESELAVAAADRIVEILARRLESPGRARLVLTGGGTPKKTYVQIAERHAQSIDWSRVDIFMGDERFVPIDDDESNMGMAKGSFLDADGISGARTFPYPTDEDDPADAALEFERTLRDYFDDGDPAFDLVLFGLGDDAHVASMFPGRAELDERHRWVIHTQAPSADDVLNRLTLTFPVLNATPTALFLVSGEGKAKAVAAGHGGDPSLPVNRVSPSRELLWYLDEGAARDIDV